MNGKQFRNNLVLKLQELPAPFKWLRWNIGYYGVVVSDGGEIMAGRGSRWWNDGSRECLYMMAGHRWALVVAAKLWLVVGGGDKIIGGRVWCLVSNAQKCFFKQRKWQYCKREAKEETFMKSNIGCIEDVDVMWMTWRRQGQACRLNNEEQAAKKIINCDL